ncbi:MAG: hypothetical protein UEY93_03160, partial [Acutalibacteraceae bacterium]|nr:hypothetical protein [Acutalibacteraceae bacterium]
MPLLFPPLLSDAGAVCLRPPGEKAGREQYGLIIVSFGEDYSASSAFFFAGAFFVGFFSAASASSAFF